MTKPDTAPEAPTSAPKPVSTTPAPAPVPVKPVTPVIPVAPAAPKGAPVTEEKREEIKAQLTDADGLVDALQLQAFKTALKGLITAKGDAGRRYGAKIATETAGYTKITKARWEQLMAEIKQKTEA